MSPNATVVNTATATGTPADAQGDPLRDENGNLLQPAVDSDTAEVQYTDVLPDIRIRKRAVPETVTEPGETVSFRIVAINRSSEEVTLDSLIDSIYGDLNGLGTCSVPQTLAPAGQPNDRYRCRFEEDVMGVAGDTETDVVTGEASDNDGNTASDDASATVTVLPLLPKITVKKTAVPTTLPEPGGDVQFRIVVINKVAKAVEITSLMDDVYGDLNGQGNCSVPQQLAPAGQAGDRYRCRFTVPVSGQPGDYRDVVVAGAEDADGNTTSADDDAIVTLTDVLPKISVDKTADPRAIDLPGGDVEFTVRVTNDAAEAVTIAVLEDDVFGPLNGQGSCVVPISLAPKGAPGDSYQCSFTGAVSGPPGIFTNTVTASGSDNDGNDTSASDVATVVLADPGIVDGIKTKLTMYYAPPDLTGVDRLTFNGYLRPVGGEVFDLPFNQDVTVIAEIPDPQNPAQVYSAFVGTVPAGSVSSAASKYRYLARGSGINELVFETVSQDKIYAYLFVDAIDLLQQVRTSMSEADYLAFIEQIDRYTLRFLIAGRSWTTEIPLLPAAVTEHKLQLEKQP